MTKSEKAKRRCGEKGEAKSGAKRKGNEKTKTKRTGVTCGDRGSTAPLADRGRFGLRPRRAGTAQRLDSTIGDILLSIAPAWSHVQPEPSACSTLSSATTLLASVEPCSEPAVAPPRDLVGHHAACQRGAMFSTSRRPAARPRRPPRCLPAWSHVQPEPSACHCVQHLEHRSTLASSVVAKRRRSPTPKSL